MSIHTAPSPAVPLAATSDARLLHTAARAALVAAIAWLVEPVLFAATLANLANVDPAQTLADFRSANWYLVLSGPGFIVVGTALVLMALSVAAVRTRRGRTTMALLMTDVLLVASGLALIAAGCIDLTGNGLAGMTLTVLPDVPENARWLSRQSFMIVHEALRLFACLGIGAWCILLAVTDRAGALVGRATRVLLWVAAVLVVVPGALTGLLTGMNFILLALVPLAVSFSRRARQAG